MFSQEITEAAKQWLNPQQFEDSIVDLLCIARDLHDKEMTLSDFVLMVVESATNECGSNQKMIGYKAFDKDLKCRGFQYEIGQTYTHTGDIEICGPGFHFCENPLNVLTHYDLTSSRFAIVKGAGVLVSCVNGVKTASSNISIIEEVSLLEFINIAVEYMTSDSSFDEDYSKLATNEDYSNLATSGYESRLSANSDVSNLATSGYGSRLSANGYESNLAANGYGSNLAANGDGSNLAANEYKSNLAANGHDSRLSANGDDSRLAANGDDSRLAANGHGSRLSANGDDSRLSANGNGSVIMAGGLRSTAKAGQDGVIALTYKDGNNRFRIAVGYVGEGLKADTFYKVNSKGQFLECDQNDY